MNRDLLGVNKFETEGWSWLDSGSLKVPDCMKLQEGIVVLCGRVCGTVSGGLPLYWTCCTPLHWAGCKPLYWAGGPVLSSKSWSFVVKDLFCVFSIGYSFWASFTSLDFEDFFCEQVFSLGAAYVFCMTFPTGYKQKHDINQKFFLRLNVYFLTGSGGEYKRPWTIKNKMAKRCRRSKTGPYNLYLQQREPILHAPSSSRRYLQRNPAEYYSVVDSSVFQDDTDTGFKERQVSCRQVNTDILSPTLPQQSALCEHDQTDARENGYRTAKEIISQTQKQDINSCNQARYEEGREVDICCDDVLENHCDETVNHLFNKASNYDVYFDCKDDGHNTDDNCSENEYELSDDIEDDSEKPLYSGSNLTLGASMLLIINFVLKYSLTGEGLCHLLELINLHCPSECILPRTKRQFWKWFEDVKQPLKFHKYCTNCHLVLSESDIKRGVCPNVSCRKDLIDNTVSHFIEGGGAADLPARSLVCNSVQFNGKYGCSKCLQAGETCKTSARGHVHIFPFHSSESQLRSHDGVKSDAIKALETDTVTNGIKEPTFLQCLQYYDLVDGVCIDYMHGVLLGVTKLMMKLWFSTEKSSELFSISSSVDLVDKRIRNIKPPNSISRVPRSIKDHMKYWKASELRSWLLYYSLPVLKDVLTQDYYDHYLLFFIFFFKTLYQCQT
ncbi:hypothetical protein KUTeg_009075 [Tegillarca granosa]|uniref:Uncharacterized protein n=1 Tax=Tegillarca granosa TaxID=220873 RepID=A0ABQ9F7L0_TEGGR|nr:hypothetical protein KUTeg_009075 [Tegillarca granosa]